MGRKKEVPELGRQMNICHVVENAKELSKSEAILAPFLKSYALIGSGAAIAHHHPVKKETLLWTQPGGITDGYLLPAGGIEEVVVKPGKPQTGCVRSADSLEVKFNIGKQLYIVHFGITNILTGNLEVEAMSPARSREEDRPRLWKASSQGIIMNVRDFEYRIDYKNQK